MSYPCNNYDCEDALGTHAPNPCQTSTRGGYPNFILLECNSSITDPSNAVQVQAAIDAGEAHVFKNVKLALPAPSPIKVDAMIANAPEKTVQYEFTGTLVDPNVNSTNITLYNQVLDGRSFGGIILHNRDEEKVYMHTAETRFEGGLVMPDNDGDIERFETSFIFRKDPDEVIPTQFAEPAGIFD